MKLWQKSYNVDENIENFTVGNDYLLDQALVKYDCIASIAHARMLAKIKVLTESECNSLVIALNEIIGLEACEKFTVKKEERRLPYRDREFPHKEAWGYRQEDSHGQIKK